MNEKTKPIRVAALLHDGVELLDFAGPVEIFTNAGYEVMIVGIEEGPITSQGVLTIVPEYTIENCPGFDILVVFGGNGVQASKNEKALSWIVDVAPNTDLLFSVCTGAFFYARAGLLEQKTVTTFHTAIDHLQEIEPTAKVLDDVKFVDEGKIITSAGISSGIEGALYVVKRYSGLEKAMDIARYIEYDHWSPETGIVVPQN